MVKCLESQLLDIIKTKKENLIPFQELSEIVSKQDIKIKKEIWVFDEVYSFKIGKIKITSSKKGSSFDYSLKLKTGFFFGKSFYLDWNSTEDSATRSKIKGIYDSVYFSYPKNK